MNTPDTEHTTPIQATPPVGVSAPAACSTAEWIAAKTLLKQWIAHNKHDRPGAWEYDKVNAQLVEDSAALLGIENPWQQ